MKRILFAVSCLLLLSQGLLAQPAAPAASCPAPALGADSQPSFMTPAPETEGCTIAQCRQSCGCPGCFKDCVDQATCHCECICP